MRLATSDVFHRRWQSLLPVLPVFSVRFGALELRAETNSELRFLEGPCLMRPSLQRKTFFCIQRQKSVSVCGDQKVVVMNFGITSVKENERPVTDPEVVRLQEVFGTSFALWEKSADDCWESLTEATESLATDSLNPVKELLEQASEQGKPLSVEIEPGRHRLVVPLLGMNRGSVKRAATATLATNSPQFLCALAAETLQGIQNQQQMEQLRHENIIFLQQVSEDFEESAFLRSMAERLALKESSQELEQLIEHTLPLLGDAVGVKSLYFLTCEVGSAVTVAQEWHENESASAESMSFALQRIVEQFAADASSTPVVRNHLQSGEHALELPGIREFILVSIASSFGQHGWLLAANRRNIHNENFHQPICKLSQNELGTNEASLINTAAAMLASHAHNLSLLDERERLLVNMVRTLVSAIDSRDPYTCGHSERVARYGKRLAEAVGFDGLASQRLYLTGLLHDIGKIGISDAVLNKDGALTGEEFAEIKRHPDLGWSILRDLEQLEYVLPGVLHHHERYDGKGYPDGLAAGDTPLDGRLLAVVDAFDAMISDRPYRQGMPVEKAIDILTDGAGSQWDAELVEKFMSVLPDILEIKDKYQRPSLPDRTPGELKDAVGALVANATPV